jgi:hypothetical protein
MIEAISAMRMMFAEFSISILPRRWRLNQSPPWLSGTGLAIKVPSWDPDLKRDAGSKAFVSCQICFRWQGFEVDQCAAYCISNDAPDRTRLCGRLKYLFFIYELCPEYLLNSYAAKPK